MGKRKTENLHCGPTRSLPPSLTWVQSSNPSGRRREPIPTPLTSKYVLWHTYFLTNTYAHIQEENKNIINNNKKKVCPSRIRRWQAVGLVHGSTSSFMDWYCVFNPIFSLSLKQGPCALAVCGYSVSLDMPDPLEYSVWSKHTMFP